LLKGKREKILQLKELNVEAEKLRSYGKSFNDDYHIRYARVVVDLESMNKEMGMYLEGIQQYCLEVWGGISIRRISGNILLKCNAMLRH